MKIKLQFSRAEIIKRFTDSILHDLQPLEPSKLEIIDEYMLMLSVDLNVELTIKDTEAKKI